MPKFSSNKRPTGKCWFVKIVNTTDHVVPVTVCLSMEHATYFFGRIEDTWGRWFSLWHIAWGSHLSCWNESPALGEHKEWVIIIINESWLSHHFDFNQYASKSTKLTPPLFHHHQQHRSRYHDHHCYQPTLLPGEALVHCWVGSLLTPPPPFPYSVGGGQITTIIAITTIFAMTLPLVQLLFITIALALSFYAKKRFSQTVQFCSGEEEADQNVKLRVRY